MPLMYAIFTFMKEYFDSKTIKELIDEVQVRERFTTTTFNLKFKNKSTRKPTVTVVDIDYADDDTIRDASFFNAVLNEIIKHKKATYIIILEPQMKFLRIYGNEAIVATSPGGFKVKEFYCLYVEDWMYFLSELVLDEGEHLIRNNQKFLDSKNFGPRHLGNIGKINKARKELKNNEENKK